MNMIEMTEDMPVSSTKAELAQHLAKVLSSSVVFKFLAHGYHWNVKSKDFRELHDFFGDIYEDVDGAVDPLAELIRKLGFDAPYFLSDFLEMSCVDGGRRLSNNADEMLMSLYTENNKMIDEIKKAFNYANENANEQGVANFLAERIDMHQKWEWQLRSTIGLDSVGF
jgi:starvation-inducible DNA-binding protein